MAHLPWDRHCAAMTARLRTTCGTLVLWAAVMWLLIKRDATALRTTSLVDDLHRLRSSSCVPCTWPAFAVQGP